MRVFIGYDSREDIAYQVARASLLKHTSIPLEITPIVQSELRQRGVYQRETDTLAATEFSFTRFLTPYLTGYKGWALFCDCDFLFRGGHCRDHRLHGRDKSGAVRTARIQAARGGQDGW